jgi:hypothetical protein
MALDRPASNWGNYRELLLKLLLADRHGPVIGA